MGFFFFFVVIVGVIYQIVTQIEDIQKQIMQWCSFLIYLRFYKIILIYLTNKYKNARLKKKKKNPRPSQKYDSTHNHISLIDLFDKTPLK